MRSLPHLRIHYAMLSPERRKAMSSLQRQPPPGSQREPPPTILIVEDSLDSRQALQTLLAGQGYMLAFAENGPDGLAQAIDLIPDLILLDVMLPGMDGLEVCRRLRANPLLAEVPIIIITALDDRDTRLQGIMAGADDFISKRFDGTELRARVRTITRLNRYRRLVRERAKFERLVELMPSGLLLADAGGTISLVNSAMMRMLDAARREDVLGQSLLQLIDPDQRDICAAELGRAVADTAAASQFETVFLHATGGAFPAEIDIGHFLWNDQPLAYVVVRDITSRRRLEGQLLQSQKMESIGRLAGGVAHDFNNLLTAIIGYAELALESLPASAQERADLQEIHHAANSAAQLTGQLLAFARQQRIEPRIFSPNELLIGLDKLLGRLIGEDIELVTLAAPDLGLIRADAGQIEQLLVNLAVNARDAMPEGGKLTIETANVWLDAAYARSHVGVEPGAYVSLVVSDTGLGMDESIKRYAFEPFFTTKEPGRGTGLGLATCYGIVKQHGGTIELYSEPGRGTAIKIYLPRVEGSADSLPPPDVATAALPRGTETVLLVEDESGVRTLVARVLGSLGYTVLEASDGDEALRFVKTYSGHAIDLLLTDVVMPRLGGRSLATYMAACFPGIKVLFTSGYAEQGIVHHGQLDQSAAFLAKPFSATALARKVRAVLDS
jgi:two-component system, cell cycle sensor histidine kinase and response regulator CckA